MADLVDGRYPQFNPFMALYGQTSNVAQADIPARSNLEYLGGSTLTDGALAASGVLCAVPIPVDPGVTISKITMLVGATAASTPTHSFGALYKGTGAAPVLIGQSTDGTTAAIAASAAFSFTLTTPYTVLSADCPQGFIYAGVAITGTAVNTAAGVSTPTAVGYQWFTNAPLGLALTAGSALNGTAAPTMVTPAAKAVAPILFLT